MSRLGVRRWVAMVIALLVAGGGHAVLGRVRRGLVWLFASLVAVATLAWSVWGLVAVLLVYVARASDAFALGPHPQRAPGPLRALVLVVCFFLVELQGKWLISRHLYVVVRCDEPQGALVSGDWVVVRRRADYGVGDVVAVGDALREVVAPQEPIGQDHVAVRDIGARSSVVVSVPKAAIAGTASFVVASFGQGGKLRLERTGAKARKAR